PINTTWKPQTKKPKAKNQNGVWFLAITKICLKLKAGLPAREDALGATYIGAFNIQAKGIIRTSKMALTMSAPDQPIFCKSSRVDGNMMNCPKEPAALAIPIARLRFSGCAARPTAESNTGKEVADRAKPKIKPTLKFSIKPVELNAISNK